MTMIVEITESGEMTLPPEAVKTLGGAESVTAERERGGGILLKPALANAPCAAPVSGAGALTLPLNALEIMRAWPAWNGVIGWDGRNIEVITAEDGRSLVLFFPPGPGSLALRERIAELGWTDEDIVKFVKQSRSELYEKEQKTARERARTEQRKAV